MADRFCPSCGTEVESDARFCPSCGTTLALEGEEEQQANVLPPAPTWPADGAEPTSESPASEEPTLTDGPTPEALSEPEPVVEAPAEPSAPPPSPPPPPTSSLPARRVAHSVAPVARSSEIPITWPTTVAGWLIGSGSLLGAIFLIATLGNVVSLLLFVALLGIATTVFAADRIPEIPRLRLLVLATTMIGLGVGLARAGFTVNGLDTLFLLAMLAAAGGMVLIELDRDRPWPPLERSGG